METCGAGHLYQDNLGVSTSAGCYLIRAGFCVTAVNLYSRLHEQYVPTQVHSKINVIPMQ